MKQTTCWKQQERRQTWKTQVCTTKILSLKIRRITEYPIWLRICYDATEDWQMRRFQQSSQVVSRKPDNHVGKRIRTKKYVHNPPQKTRWVPSVISNPRSSIQVRKILRVSTESSLPVFPHDWNMAYVKEKKGGSQRSGWNTPMQTDLLTCGSSGHQYFVGFFCSSPVFRGIFTLTLKQQWLLLGGDW